MPQVEGSVCPAGPRGSRPSPVLAPGRRPQWSTFAATSASRAVRAPCQDARFGTASGSRRFQARRGDGARARSADLPCTDGDRRDPSARARWPGRL